MYENVGYVWEEKLRATWKQNCFKFTLKNRERRQFVSVLRELIPILAAGPEYKKRPFSEFYPKLRLDSSSYDSTNLRNADVKVYLQTASRRTGTKGSDRCARCTSSSTTCTRLLSEPLSQCSSRRWWVNVRDVYVTTSILCRFWHIQRRLNESGRQTHDTCTSLMGH